MERERSMRSLLVPGVAGALILGGAGVGIAVAAPVGGEAPQPAGGSVAADLVARYPVFQEAALPSKVGRGTGADVSAVRLASIESELPVDSSSAIRLKVVGESSIGSAPILVSAGGGVACLVIAGTPFEAGSASCGPSDAWAKPDVLPWELTYLRGNDYRLTALVPAGVSAIVAHQPSEPSGSRSIAVRGGLVSTVIDAKKVRELHWTDASGHEHVSSLPDIL